MKRSIFWLYGIIQSVSLGFIIYLLFRSMNIIHGDKVIGADTQIVLSIVFPLFLLLVEYVVYSKRGR